MDAHSLAVCVVPRHVLKVDGEIIPVRCGGMMRKRGAGASEPLGKPPSPLGKGQEVVC